MRSGTDRMRHYRYRNFFRFFVWHGLRFGLGNRHSLFPKQLRCVGYGQRRIRRLRFEWYVEHQPQLQLFHQPEQLRQQFIIPARQHNTKRRLCIRDFQQLRHFGLYRHIQLRLHQRRRRHFGLHLALIKLASGVSRFTLSFMARHTTVPFHDLLLLMCEQIAFSFKPSRIT
jgi:hypothetical protein